MVVSWKTESSLRGLKYLEPSILWFDFFKCLEPMVLWKIKERPIIVVEFRFSGVFWSKMDFVIIVLKNNHYKEEKYRKVFHKLSWYKVHIKVKQKGCFKIVILKIVILKCRQVFLQIKSMGNACIITMHKPIGGEVVAQCIQSCTFLIIWYQFHQHFSVPSCNINLV